MITRRFFRTASLAIAGALALAACRTPSIGVYRMDVQQGNVVTQDMIDRLEPGMDKRKVRYVLGTPLVEDSFNPDRWDYYYSFQDGRRDRTHRRLTLYFEAERLARIEGDVSRAAERREVVEPPEQVVVVPDRPDAGLFAALTPPFLRRDKREDALEQSRPEAAERRPGEAVETVPEEVAAAAPAPSTAPAPGAPETREALEEADTFRRLFQGFGRTDGADLVLPEPPVEKEEPAPAPAPPTADAEDATPESTEQEKGFFSGLVDRLRRERGEEPADAEETEPYLEEPGSED